MKYFLQKKFILGLLFILVIGGGIFVLFSFKSPLGKTASFERSVGGEAEEVFNAVVFKDSDGDGLKDWEEALWKTDPQNPDSDSDGTSDGEEVRFNRDPLKPAPGDALEIPTTEKQKPADSFTNSLLKDTFSSYQLIQQPGVANEQLFKKINQSLAQKIRTKITDPDVRVYKIKDISITIDNSEKSISEYKNQLRKMGDKYANTYESEIIIIRKAINTDDARELEKLDDAKDTYEKMIEDLLVITVPSDLAQTHINIINTYSTLIDSIKKMKEMVGDPIIGIAGILQYQQSSKNLLLIAVDLGFQKLPDTNN